jgi:hypothetical protein
MRALLEDLQVHPDNRPAVDAEITKLDATVATGFAGSVDKNQALPPDLQGIGAPAASDAGSRTAST